jgi:aryl-alcohol dehydrogenase-like predicted oxidoreductase
VKYRQLGRSALKVSELCLGTMNFGPRTSASESFAILNGAVEAGINFVDTANQYGGHLGVGATETLLGQWLAEDGGRRDRIVLATKVHEPMSDDVNDRGLSARHIQMACDASLKRLQVDHIDLYQMHHIDRTAPPEEVWQAMDRLIAQGKITYVGSSNFPGWAIAQAGEKAIVRQRLGSSRNRASTISWNVALSWRCCPPVAAYGVGVITWSPLAGGLLADGGVEPGGRRGSEAAIRAAADRSGQLSGFGVLCEELGQSPSVVALAWLLHQPGVAATIVGPRSLDQLLSVLHAPELTLDEGALARIDAIFPGYGPAPEAYAW